MGNIDVEIFLLELLRDSKWSSRKQQDARKLFHGRNSGRFYSFTAAANKLLTFWTDASSSAFRQVCERSIWRIKPVRTLPGPTSMKVFTPRLISVCMDLAHCTAPVTWR